MGYTTYFEGSFAFDRPLTENQRIYLKKFSETRRMGRKTRVLEKMPDPVRDNVGLPIGTEGEFYVGATGLGGQDPDSSIVDYNRPPSTQPGLWCHLTPNNDGSALEWSGAEKFYHYKVWLNYLIDNFIRPWGYILNGRVTWSGEYFEDIGIIVVENNYVKIGSGKIVYEFD